MPNKIAVYNFKGGVGKTSTAINLALNWSKSFKVLLIDCDPQANLTSALTGKQEYASNLFSISKKLLHNTHPDINPIAISHYLHLIPGDYHMVELESNSQFISFGHLIFYHLLSDVRNIYDLIVLDLPTHFGVIVKSFIANINSILIPAIADSFSVSGFQKLLGYLAEVKKDKPLNVLGIFFNQYRKHTLHHQKILKAAKKKLGSLILDQVVRQSIGISEAQSIKRSTYLYKEACEAASDFTSLSDEIIERLNTFELDEVIDEMEMKIPRDKTTLRNLSLA